MFLSPNSCMVSVTLVAVCNCIGYMRSIAIQGVAYILDFCDTRLYSSVGTILITSIQKYSISKYITGI